MLIALKIIGYQFEVRVAVKYIIFFMTIIITLPSLTLNDRCKARLLAYYPIIFNAINIIYIIFIRKINFALAEERKERKKKNERKRHYINYYYHDYYYSV
jgi:hypothetical protein